MLRSAGRRFLIVGFLVLLMFIPLFFAAEIIDSRKSYSERTITTVSKEWGGKQSLSGPQMMIPVLGTVTRMVTRPRTDPDTGVVLVDADTGKEITERFEKTSVERTGAVYLYPDQFDAKLNTRTQLRSRGIFQVPVYQAEANFTFNFTSQEAEAQINESENLLWDETEIRLFVTSNRALRGQAKLLADGNSLPLEPLTRESGFRALSGDPRGQGKYTLELGFNGARSLMLVPVGRQNAIEMTSDWPHPSFGGNFLPDGSEIDENGFSARWTIPHLARALPQVSRDDPNASARHIASFGVTYLQPNDFYQKAFRAARYGILFIALTFLTILLMEKGSDRPAHPVQYILIGLAQSVFVLLMLSYAEHLGFTLAYIMSSAATIALLTLFGFTALRLDRRALVLAVMLIVVYAVLYLILKLADYALLAGSTLAFLALAVTMIATRDEDWYGAHSNSPPERGGPGFV